MTTIDDAAREAADPVTPPARLAELLTARPDLGAMIARHPQSYPEMLAWIGEHGDPAAQAAVLDRLAPPMKSAVAPGAQPPSVAPRSVPVAPAAVASTASTGSGASGAPRRFAPVSWSERAEVTEALPPLSLVTVRAAQRRRRGRAVMGIVAGVAALVVAGGAFAVSKGVAGGPIFGAIGKDLTPTQWCQHVWEEAGLSDLVPSIAGSTSQGASAQLLPAVDGGQGMLCIGGGVFLQRMSFSSPEAAQKNRQRYEESAVSKIHLQKESDQTFAGVSGLYGEEPAAGFSFGSEIYAGTETIDISVLNFGGRGMTSEEGRDTVSEIVRIASQMELPASDRGE